MSTDRFLFVARPPYTKFVPAALSASPAIGDVVGLLISADADEQVLLRRTRNVIRSSPAAAVIAVYSRETERARATRVAAAVGLGLVPLEANPLAPMLRGTVTSFERLPSTFAQWLRVSGLTSDRRLIALLGRMIGQSAERWSDVPDAGVSAPDHGWPGVTQMARLVGLTPRGLRAAFARNRLPPPVQWKILARDLVHALLIQRDPTAPLTRTALMLGYADAQALSHAFHHCFGVTPSFVRERLGWPWLALRWREKQAFVRNRHSTAGFDHAHPA